MRKQLKKQLKKQKNRRRFTERLIRGTSRQGQTLCRRAIAVRRKKENGPQNAI
ncbi:hypothetical protein [Fulvitalea axinellae]|uniref:hypothetical protein n=1 Tax=Fulvitalea axinellae TaxID=1182444 RepID=UPI0030CA355C